METIIVHIIQGLGLRCRIYGLEFRVSDFGFRVWALGVSRRGWPELQVECYNSTTYKTCNVAVQQNLGIRYEISGICMEPFGIVHVAYLNKRQECASQT